MSRLRSKTNRAVAERLDEIGWNQSDLARKLGVSTVSVTYVCTENWKRASPQIADRISEVLDFDPFDVMPESVRASKARGQRNTEAETVYAFEDALDRQSRRRPWNRTVDRDAISKLAYALEALDMSDRERHVIRLTMDGGTYRSIGAALGVSCERARQVRVKLFDRIKDKVREIEAPKKRIAI